MATPAATPQLSKQTTPPLATPVLARTGTAQVPTPSPLSAAAQASKEKFWGKLVPVQAGLVPVNLAKDKTTIGRAAENDVALTDNTYVSSSHCAIVHEAGSDFLVDSSTNGTLINDVRVPKGDKVPLPVGSKITIVPVKDGTVGVEYFLQLTADGISAREESVVANLLCCICQCIVHDAVSVVPCLHVFCGGCLSEWEEHSNSDCPQCRTAIKQVNRNTTINGLAETFLQTHPDRRRTAEEIADLNSKNKYTGDKMREAAAKRRRVGRHRDDDDDEEDEDDYDDDEEEEDDDGPAAVCRSCLTAATADGFVCPTGGAHTGCQCCGDMLPIRPPGANPINCAHCHQVFCSMYWTCRPFSGCRGTCLQRQRDVVLAYRDLDRVVNNNSFESKVLKDFLEAKTITATAFYQDCIAKVQAGEFTCTIPVTPDLPLCRTCRQTAVGELAYQYREKIKPEDLPDAVKRRGNCWYGKGCRTQHHNDPHATKLNHVCPPSR
eukprot:m.242957 g.242957  ORF g.242957 m.242957 type:complete len:493 (+) comp14130_c0_seq1:37-1515(+)